MSTYLHTCSWCKLSTNIYPQVSVGVVTMFEMNCLQLSLWRRKAFSCRAWRVQVSRVRRHVFNCHVNVCWPIILLSFFSFLRYSEEKDGGYLLFFSFLCLHCTLVTLTTWHVMSLFTLPFLTQLLLTTVTKTTVLTLTPGTYIGTDTGPGTDTDRYQTLNDRDGAWCHWCQLGVIVSTDMAKTPAVDTDKNKKYWQRHRHKHCHCHTPCGYTRHWQRHQVLSLPLKRPHNHDYLFGTGWRNTDDTHLLVCYVTTVTLSWTDSNTDCIQFVVRLVYIWVLHAPYDYWWLPVHTFVQQVFWYLPWVTPLVCILCILYSPSPPPCLFVRWLNTVNLIDQSLTTIISVLN